MKKYLLVRYREEGFTAQRTEEIARVLLKKGRVEVIEKTEARVVLRPEDMTGEKFPGKEEEEENRTLGEEEKPVSDTEEDVLRELEKLGESRELDESREPQNLPGDTQDHQPEPENKNRKPERNRRRR